MIQLLEHEEVLADLHKGTVQNISQDLFSNKTIILTTKRLIVADNSSATKNIFLNNVQSVSAQSTVNWLLLAPAIALAIFALFWLTDIIPQYNYNISTNTRTPMSFGERLPLSVFVGVIAGVLAFFAKQKSILVFTSADRTRVPLRRGANLGTASNFVHRVLGEVDKSKKS